MDDLASCRTSAPAAWRLAMTPDTSDWADDDLRWTAGYGKGFWLDCAGETEARTVGEWLAGQGWTVTIRPIGEIVEGPPGVLLSGIVGSVAYGLDTEASDVDRLGVFAAATEALVGLNPPKQSIVTTAPDATFHEAGKFAALALKANPTITELMWLPDDLIEVRTPLGDALRNLRHCFLSRKAVRNAYLGYATQQFRRLENRCDGSFSADTRKRTAKHARHLLRLLAQGTALHVTGVLSVRVKDPDLYHHFGEQVAAGDLDLARERLARAEIQFDAPSALAERPAEEAVEAWLGSVRRAFFERAA